MTTPDTKRQTLSVGAALVGLGLVQPGFGLLEGVGVLGLVGGLALHLNLKTLRKKFGYDHA